MTTTIKEKGLLTISYIKNFIRKHKVWSVVIAIAIIFFGYKVYGAMTATAGTTSYVSGTVSRGAIVSSISGTGQVSASNEIALTSKVSGNIVAVGAFTGQELKAGKLIVQIDSSDIRISLESAQIAYKKLTKPADASSIIQAENSLADAKLTLANAQTDLSASYDDAFTEVSTTYIDLPDVMTGLRDMFYGSTGYLSDFKNYYGYDRTSQSYRAQAGQGYDVVRNTYDANLIRFKALSRTSSTSTLETFINDTYVMTKQIADVVKNTRNTVDYLKDKQTGTAVSEALTAQSNLGTWNTKASGHVSGLYSAKSTIESSKNAIISSHRAIVDKQQTLIDLKSGTDPLDVRSGQLTLQQKQNEYQDYFIKAPFDGVLAKLNVKKGDAVSGGASIATFISKQKVASISLNEVDIVKIKVGQKVTLTFDAIEDLSMTGTVAEVDLVGTVTQGVVSYNVKIAFDTEDERVKSGMTVSAAIITASKQDILIVPSSAVKSQGDMSYVEILDASGNVMQIPVEVGATDDTNTEIISGLAESDSIITRTITTTVKAGAASAPSATSLLGGQRGGTGGGTGAVRIQR